QREIKVVRVRARLYSQRESRKRRSCGSNDHVGVRQRRRQATVDVRRRGGAQQAGKSHVDVHRVGRRIEHDRREARRWRAGGRNLIVTSKACHERDRCRVGGCHHHRSRQQEKSKRRYQERSGSCHVLASAAITCCWLVRVETATTACPDTDSTAKVKRRIVTNE